MNPLELHMLAALKLAEAILQRSTDPRAAAAYGHVHRAIWRAERRPSVPEVKAAATITVHDVNNPLCNAASSALGILEATSMGEARRHYVTFLGDVSQASMAGSVAYLHRAERETEAA